MNKLAAIVSCLLIIAGIGCRKDDRSLDTDEIVLGRSKQIVANSGIDVYVSYDPRGIISINWSGSYLQPPYTVTISGGGGGTSYSTSYQAYRVLANNEEITITVNSYLGTSGTTSFRYMNGGSSGGSGGLVEGLTPTFYATFTHVPAMALQCHLTWNPDPSYNSPTYYMCLVVDCPDGYWHGIRYFTIPGNAGVADIELTSPYINNGRDDNVAKLIISTLPMVEGCPGCEPLPLTPHWPVYFPFNIAYQYMTFDISL